MMRATLLLTALSLQAASVSAVAQSPAPQPPATSQPAASGPAREREPLNLRLDDTSRRQIMSGTRSEEKGPGADNLPTLGGDARKMERPRGSPSGGAPDMKDGRGID